MPVKGFTTTYGARVPFAEIDIVRDAELFNSSPATLAHLLRITRDRDSLPDGITASQMGKEIRQMLLEQTRDLYPATGELMSSYGGTLVHEQVNVQHGSLIVEERFVSKRNPRISGKIDHAAIVDLDSDGTLWVDLYDLKRAKWYSVTLMWKDLWKNHPEYGWQLNLCAALMEQFEDDPALWPFISEFAMGLIGVSSVPIRRIRVRNMYLECIPQDSSYKHGAEAEKLGIPDYRKVIIPVERKCAAETFDVFEWKLAAKDKAIAEGWAPICEDTWTTKYASHARCRFFCTARDACLALADERNEAHPLDTTEDLLRKSVAMRCPSCGGSGCAGGLGGRDGLDEPIPCPDCDGEGIPIPLQRSLKKEEVVP